jgi:hypothetical protein
MSRVAGQQTGHVQGRVVDATTRHPIPSATVFIEGALLTTVTGADGSFRINDLEEGVYSVSVRHLGYADFVHTDVAIVRRKATLISEIGLVSTVLALEGITATIVTPPSVSRYAVQREEIRRTPGTSGDVLRALGTLPGVSVSEGEFSAMSVRGGGAHDNLILIDNIPFDKINHFEGGSNEQEAQGGRFSVFTAGLVERAIFYGGGFGAEHGRKGASVLDLEISEGNPESPTVSGSYDLLGLELNYDGPTYLLPKTSLRANYRDFDMKRGLEIGGLQDFGDPTMSDVIIKTSTHVNERNKVSVLGIYSTDRLVRAPHHLLHGDDLVENAIWDIDETRWLLGANWRWLTSGESVLHNTFYYRTNDRFRSIGFASADATGGRLPSSVADLTVRENVGIQNQREIEIGWKADFDHAVRRGGTFRLGLEAYRIQLDYDYAQAGADTLYRFTRADLLRHPDQRYLVVPSEAVAHSFDKAAVNAAAYVSYELGLGRLVLTPGGRYSRSGFSTQSTVAPRLQVRYQLSPSTAANFATGTYYQAPSNIHITSDAANRMLRDEKSVHYILGINRYLRDDLRLTLETYYKELSDLVVPAATGGRALTNGGDGWSSGFDAILLKRLSNRYHGQVSYSYAISRRDDHDGWGEYNSSFNQPHNVGAIVGYQANKAWFISGRWKYAVGRPKDRFIVHENVLGDGAPLRYSKEITARNADRLPAFHLLSTRLDYRKQLGRFAVTSFLEMDNLYNRFNTYEARFSELTGEEKALGFGFLPNFGFKLEF